MQAWTPVSVIDPDHPRKDTAGTCQGAPFTLANATAADAQRLADVWKEADKLADAARAELAAATVKAQDADRVAAEALAVAHAAQAAAAGEPTDTAERVRVKFDTDGQVVEMRVDQLQVLA
jgi:hypothetical protein